MRVSICLGLMAFASSALLAQGRVIETPAPLPTVKPATNAIVLDRKVAGVNADTYAALQAIAAAERALPLETRATKVIEEVKKDGKVDAAEADLLIELADPATRQIRIARAGAAPDEVPVELPTLSYQAKLLLGTLYPAEAMAAQLDSGAKGWKALIAAARSHPRGEEQVTAFLAARMSERWAQSTTANAYAPYVNFISPMLDWSRAAGPDPDDVQAGKILAYRASAVADRNAQGAIPDFLYTWFLTAK